MFGFGRNRGKASKNDVHEWIWFGLRQEVHSALKLHRAHFLIPESYSALGDMNIHISLIENALASAIKGDFSDGKFYECLNRNYLFEIRRLKGSDPFETI